MESQKKLQFAKNYTIAILANMDENFRLSNINRKQLYDLISNFSPRIACPRIFLSMR